MKSTLSITHNCNLGCTYFYAGKKFKQDVSLESAKRCVDFSFDITPRGESIVFGLFGGKPLLRFDLIRQVVAYIHERSQQQSHRFNLIITTNSTLITEDIVAFIKQIKTGLFFSIDGPKQTHDGVRHYRNGKSSFNKVVNNLKLAADTLTKRPSPR